MLARHNIDAWYEENKALFDPPICNKLMHKDDLTIMFVGGPNTRTDFHLEEGSEFFYQMRGKLELPTIQNGKRVVVTVNAGEVFLLPSRIPHAPQRPDLGSLGLVIERKRVEGQEYDGLRWYGDFDTCADDDVLWERYFYMDDLKRDFLPVIQAYKASDECQTLKRPAGVSVADNPNIGVPAHVPFAQDTTTEVPMPFKLADWLASHADALTAGETLSLFNNDLAAVTASAANSDEEKSDDAVHPDREFTVNIVGGAVGEGDDAAAGREYVTDCVHESWWHQMSGDDVSVCVTPLDADAAAAASASWEPLKAGECASVPKQSRVRVRRPAGSIGMVVWNNPLGNKK